MQSIKVECSRPIKLFSRWECEERDTHGNCSLNVYIVPHSILHSVKYTLLIVYYILGNVNLTPCLLYSVYYLMYIAHCILCTIQYAHCILHSVY